MQKQENFLKQEKVGRLISESAFVCFKLRHLTY